MAQKFTTGDILATSIIFLIFVLCLGAFIVFILRKITSKPKTDGEKIDKLIEQNEEIIRLLKSK